MKLRIIAAFFMIGFPILRAQTHAIEKLGDLESYRVAPYLEAAIELQSVSKEEAVAQLQKFADTREYNEQIVILCRMLFEPEQNSVLRAPMLGAPQFYGGTSVADWIFEPITIIDGIPFKIVLGYSLFGHAEEAPEYLQYCLESTAWTSRKYENRTPEAIHSALQRLIKLRVWRKPLDQWEIDRINEQIRG